MRQRQSGAPLAATNVTTAGSVCKRRDAVRLGRKEGLQPRASERPAVGCSEKLGAARDGESLRDHVVVPENERRKTFTLRHPSESIPTFRLTLIREVRVKPSFA